MPTEEETKTVQEGSVNKISMRLPSFWHENPRLYFSQVEANFELSGISTEKTKSCCLIASLDQQTMLAVSDLIETPDPKEPYTVLKNRLIDTYDISQTERIKTLLQDLTLADSKPSALLRRMRELAGKNFSEDVIRTIWLSRLPTTVQSILSVSSETLDKLSGLADKISEVTSFSTAVCQAVASPSLEAQIADLRQDVSALKFQIAELAKSSETPRGRAHSRNKSHFRKKFRSKSGDSNTAQDKDSTLCWYHARFGDKARDCVEPCSFLNL